VDVEVQGAQANLQLALTASYNWPRLGQTNRQLALTASYNWPGQAYQLGVASVDSPPPPKLPSRDYSYLVSGTHCIHTDLELLVKVACRTLQLIEES
jgi:hypothetical protein